jgi:DNA modification methylase
MIKINLMKGDCLERMKEIPDKSVDMVLTDPPYGTTACKWDSVIPFDKMWAELKRIVRNEKSAIVLFGSEPFSSALRMSNIKEFKYDWVWRKNHKTGISFAKYQPMRAHEIISVFCKGNHVYNKQMEDCAPSVKKRWRDGQENKLVSRYHSDHLKTVNSIQRYKTNPSSVLDFNVVPRATGTLHPTQKPVPLLEYLIKTYTLEGETVLDFTMGSGSTGVACKNLNRNFIGIERDDKYFEIAKKRIEEA